MSNNPSKWSRRTLLKTLTASPLFLAHGLLRAQDEIHRIRVQLSYPFGMWYFEPFGLYVEKGATVEWLSTRWGPTVTAFHPSNGNQELRMPEGAEPFDSGLMSQGDTFRWTFDVEGTYDYFSKNHVGLGMVGRIIVGRPGGPGEKPPRYGGAEGRAPIYQRAMEFFAEIDSQEIVRLKKVSVPTDKLGRQYPEY